MSFRMINTKSGTDPPVQREAQKPEKIYTQEEIDLIDVQYKEREQRYKKLIEEPSNGLLDQYRKNLLTSTPVEKEVIVFDQTLRKWRLVKETDEQKK